MDNSNVFSHIALDIDECSVSTPCDQGCTNTMGSFTCSCQAGFDLGDDGRTCNG